MREDQVDGVEASRNEVVVQDGLPVRVNGSLAVPNEANALLHDRANVEVVREARVDARDADGPCEAFQSDSFSEKGRAKERTERNDRLDAFVDNLGRLGLDVSSDLDLVLDSLCALLHVAREPTFLETSAQRTVRSAIERNIKSSRLRILARRLRELLEPRREVLVVVEVDELDLGDLGLGVMEPRLDTVDKDDARSALEKGPLGAELRAGGGQRARERRSERARTIPMGPTPQIPTMSPCLTPESRTQWYEVARTLERRRADSSGTFEGILRRFESA